VLAYSAFAGKPPIMSRTPNLDLPFILASQADKHVSFNEAVNKLDDLIQLSVESRTLATPPPSPVEGVKYIVPAGASNVWSGQGGKIAAYKDSGWLFYTAQEGWQAWVKSEGRIARFSNSGWGLVPLVETVNPISLVGVNTIADTINKLAVKSDAVLLSHDPAGSGDMRLKINKSQASGTASLVFQSNWSGHAEMGLAGDKSFRVKVSDDGTSFNTALVADPVSGGVKLPCGLIDSVTGLRALTLVPAVVRDIWRSDMDAPPSPRTYTIASVSGNAVTITTPEVEQLYCQFIRGISKVRIWNTSKSPPQAAWVNWNVSATEFSVHNSSDIASWSAGETLRIGDPNPTGTNALNMIAIDIGDYLFNSFGVVFPQRGLKISIASHGVGGRVSIDCSGNGAPGSAFGTASNSDGSRQSAFADVFTNVPSPISNSNLFFIREALTAPATALAATRLIRIVGVWV
jgi:Protein of unknown function (DUF2793)